MSDLITKAVVYNPDGTVFYRQENEWTNLNAEQEAWLRDKLDQHDQYLKQLEKEQKKGADAVLSATLSRTGQPDLTFTEIDHDSLEKARRAWDKIGDEIMKRGKERVKGKP